MSVSSNEWLNKVLGSFEIEKLAGGFQFTEGPVWVSDGYLLFSDIPANSIYKWTPGEETEIFRKPSGHANGLSLDCEGRLLACEHDGRVSRTEKDGSIVSLAEHFDGKRLNSPNDIAVKSDGSIYFTDPPYGLPEQKVGKELTFNGVFRLDSGILKLLDDSFERPNGIAFSPDERVLYVDDSARGHIRAFDVGSDGLLENGRIFAELRNPSEEGVPDGMKVDVEGNVFCTGPGGIWVLEPSGELLGVLRFPEIPANLAWGAPDRKTMYVTARTGLYRRRVNTGGSPLTG